jgi:hypothetical protein
MKLKKHELLKNEPNESSILELISQIHNLLNPRSGLNKLNLVLKNEIKKIYKFLKKSKVKKNSNKKTKEEVIIKKKIKMISNKINNNPKNKNHI